jgi:hypothetical protein
LNIFAVCDGGSGNDYFVQRGGYDRNGGTTAVCSRVRTSSWSFVVTVACGTRALQADALVMMKWLL